MSPMGQMEHHMSPMGQMEHHMSPPLTTVAPVSIGHMTHTAHKELTYEEPISEESASEESTIQPTRKTGSDIREITRKFEELIAYKHQLIKSTALRKKEYAIASTRDQQQMGKNAREIARLTDKLIAYTESLPDQSSKPEL